MKAEKIRDWKKKMKRLKAAGSPFKSGRKPDVKSAGVRMVDVAEKAETLRTAEARGEVRLSTEVLRMILENRLPKGDVLNAARLAAIQAAKKTSELIPLCHPLRITSVEVEVRPVKSKRLVEVKSLVRAFDRTGVEMEALTAVAVACLSVYDMCKAFDKRMVIADIHLLSKTGGKSGDFNWKRGSKNQPGRSRFSLA